LTRAEAQQIFARVQMRVMKEFAYSIPYWSRLRQTALENLETLHCREPTAIAFPEKALLSAPREVALAVTAELLRAHAIVKEASGVRLASRLPKLQGHGGIRRYVHGCRPRIIRRRLWQRLDPVEDLVQEVFIAAWENLNSFRGASLRGPGFWASRDIAT
jgi:hypothetical protein